MAPAVPLPIGKARGRKDWIDATICELASSHSPSCGGRLVGRIGDDRDSGTFTSIGSHSPGTFSTEGGDMCRIAL